MRLEKSPIAVAMPAHELTTVRIINADANHAADVAHRARPISATAATKPAMAVPIEAPPMMIRAANTRPTAEGSALKLNTKKPHVTNTVEPAISAEGTQRGALISEAML